MSEVPTITVSLDKKCVKCKQAGVTPSGLCMGCIAKLIVARTKKRHKGGRVSTIKEAIAQLAKTSIEGERS